jgi:hypothetical protein
VGYLRDLKHEKNKNCRFSGFIQLHFFVLPGFCRNSAATVSYTGKNTVCSGITGFECAGIDFTDGINFTLWQSLLFFALPHGCFSGSGRLAGEAV